MLCIDMENSMKNCNFGVITVKVYVSEIHNNR